MNRTKQFLGFNDGMGLTILKFFLFPLLHRGRPAGVQVVEGVDTEGSPISTITSAPVGVDAAGCLVLSNLYSHGTTIKTYNDCSLNEHLVEVNVPIFRDCYLLAKNGAHQYGYLGVGRVLPAFYFLGLSNL